MTKLNNQADRGVARLGVIVPVSNSNLEPDMVMMKPFGVSIHFARAGGYDLDVIPDSTQMRQFAETSLDQVLQEICAVRPDVVIYGCTSATLSLGPEFDSKFCQRIAKQSGVKAITAAGALVQALSALGVSRAAFASPYTEVLNQEGAAFLEKSGITIVNLAYIGSDLGNFGQGELTPEEIVDLGQRANHVDAEAVILSCTDMRGAEIVDELEAIIGKPVVTSNQALMYVASKCLGLRGQVPGKLGLIG